MAEEQTPSTETPQETPQETPVATPPVEAGGVNAMSQESQTAVTNNPDKLANISGADAGLNDKFSKLLYDAASKMPENKFVLFNGKDNMKISIFAVNKFLYAENKNVNFIWDIDNSSRNIIELLYNKDVEQLCIEDALDEIGSKGSLLLKCEGSRFQGLLENYMQYDIVIGITLMDDENRKISIEPYIFNIIKVEQISNVSDQNKRFIVSFVDILSYVAMNHNFASVRKLAGSALASAQNYETLFNIIYDYLAKFIQRFTLGTYTYNKIGFLENSDVDTSELVKMTISKIGQNATVYDALKQIQYDACTPIVIDSKKAKSIEKDFELFDDNCNSALVPLFFKEEYLYYSAAYTAQFDTSDLKDKVKKNYASSIDDEKIIKRQFFKRNFSMPFYFAFNKNDYSNKKIIFESLNPQLDNRNNDIIENEYDCIMGCRISPITRITTNCIDMKVNNLRWKNMIFVFESEKNGSHNYLLRFNWLYNFYNSALLNQNLTNQKKICGILPDFYMNELIGSKLGKFKPDLSIRASDANSSNNSSSPVQPSTEDNKDNSIELTDLEFDEYNANIFLIRSENETKETQYYVGKMLASFVLLNTSYIYDVEGSLFRRPNEIIKINRHIDNIAYIDPNTISPSVLNGKIKDTLVYVTNVKHVFKGTSYINVITSNKICDSLE